VRNSSENFSLEFLPWLEYIIWISAAAAVAYNQQRASVQEFYPAHYCRGRNSDIDPGRRYLYTLSSLLLKTRVERLEIVQIVSKFSIPSSCVPVAIHFHSHSKKSHSIDKTITKTMIQYLWSSFPQNGHISFNYLTFFNIADNV